jgi:hypothetical protein
MQAGAATALLKILYIAVDIAINLNVLSTTAATKAVKLNNYSNATRNRRPLNTALA